MEPLLANLPELLYIQDPLCGWCYGMSPVINRVQQAFAGRIEVSVLCGGMVKGDDVGPIAETWDYLKQALGDVEKVAGVQFGEAFLALGAGAATCTTPSPPAVPLRRFRQITQIRPAPWLSPTPCKPPYFTTAKT
jgi:putative protein-disulfide isomerase